MHTSSPYRGRDRRLLWIGTALLVIAAQATVALVLRGHSADVSQTRSALPADHVRAA